MDEFVKPLTAAVEKLSTRDATSLLIVVLIAFAAISFGISIAAPAPLNWMIGFTGLGSFLIGVGAFGYALLVKPERLRTEETVRMGMLLDWIKRADVDDDHRDAAATLLPVLLEVKSQKRVAMSREKEGRDG